MISSDDREKTELGSRTLKRRPIFKALFYSENPLHLLSVTGFSKLFNTLYLSLISRGAQSLISHLKKNVLVGLGLFLWS